MDLSYVILRLSKKEIFCFVIYQLIRLVTSVDFLISDSKVMKRKEKPQLIYSVH